MFPFFPETHLLSFERFSQKSQSFAKICSLLFCDSLITPLFGPEVYHKRVANRHDTLEIEDLTNVSRTLVEH